MSLWRIGKFFADRLVTSLGSLPCAPGYNYCSVFFESNLRKVDAAVKMGC